MAFVAEIGASDCEHIGDGLLAQPTNALTSFVYVVIGVVLIVAAARRRTNLGSSAIYGLCLAAIGLGSVAFHGPQVAGSRILHDLPILLTVGFMVIHNLRLLVPSLRFGLVFAGLAIGSLVISFVSLDALAALTGLGLVTVVATEVPIYRRRLRPEDAAQQRRAYWVIAAVTAIAAVTWVLGRTDSPLCAPDSPLQVHGLWHLLSAFAFGVWGWLALIGGAADDRDRSTDALESPGPGR